MKKSATALSALLFAAVPLVAAAAEKTVTANGVVESYSAVEHAFSVKTDTGATVRFVWTKETKFNGVVANGARVTVRYTPQPGGPNVAQTVGVLK
ncbi:MAG TPA: hypothetical protein VKH46_02270 [Thermoanaerobaculia bacterium]|nr:hypothetical protein [Thermoanaerobaculia bacterium]